MEPGGQRAESGGIVGGVIRIAHRAGTEPAQIPAHCGGQRLPDLRAVTPAPIVRLTLHIVDQLRAFDVTRHMPAVWTHPLHPARIGIRGGGVAHPHRGNPAMPQHEAA